MKKLLSLILVLVLAVGITGCSSNNEKEEEKETVTITALDGNKKECEVEVPYDPERIAVLDMAVLDILDNLDLGDSVVGSSTTSLDYLQDYVNNDDIVNLGTIKEADMEAVMECEPDIIFIGGRLSASYDDLSEIAPVVFLATDTEAGLVKSVSNNAKIIASIFGLEDEVDEKIDVFNSRIEKLAEFAEGKTALLGMTTSGSFNLLGNDGRCSLIPNEIGFENIGVEAATAASSENSTRGGRGNSNSDGSSDNSTSGTTPTHGNETTFELVLQLNPDYIFVMDRDAAIGTDGAQLAKDIMENELVAKTNAYQNNQIIYLEHPAVWYTAEGGITALDMMLKDLESALNI